jgi:hypothetical protein
VTTSSVRRYLASAAVLAAAGLAAAGCGSSGTSASAPSPSPSSGTQTASGTVTGEQALAGTAPIPLHLTGVVDTTATVKLAANPVTIKTGQGDLAVTRTSGSTSQKLLSTKTCKFAFGQRENYTVDGGKSTGTFKGASGTGTAVVTLTGTLPKNGDGRCNTSSSAVPQPASARVSFVARGPLTIRK